MNSKPKPTSLRRTRWWGKAALLGAALALGTTGLHAQSASTYTFTATSGTYTEIATGTDLASARVDSYLSPAQNIGFSFDYEGTTYTQFKMSSDGYITLNMSATSTILTNNFETANATSRPIIAPLWDDLDGNVSTPLTSVARYAVDGAAPNRVLTVEWRYWQWNYNASGNTISFQVKLYETTNAIEFIYRQESGTVSSPSASIGIGSATGSGAGSYLNLTSIASPAVSSTSSVTNLATKPATGTIYRFEPPLPCSGTPNAGSITTPQGICAGSTITLTATGLTVGPGISYQWEESPDGIGSWASVVGGSGANTPSYTTTAINATRYFRITTTCSSGPSSNSSNVVTVNALAPVYAVYTVAGYTESFESTWSNLCSTRDVPGSAWKNSPASGYNTWRRNDDNTSGGWQLNTGGAYSPAASNGSYSARFHSYGATSGMIGQLDLYLDMSAASGNEDLRFDWINPSGSDVLKVYVSTDGGANFTQLGANMGVATSWTEAYRNVTSTSATTVIRFEATSDYGNNDIGLDNVRLNPPPACPIPMSVTANSISTTSATISWTCAGCTGSYIVEYGPAGFTPGTDANAGGGTIWTGTAVPGSPVTITGLASNTAYTVYVRQMCGASDFSANSAATNFSTAFDCDVNAIAITSLPVTNQSVVCGGGNYLNATNVPATCGAATNSYKGGEEALYTFVPTLNGQHTISYSGVTYTGIFLYANACPTAGGTCVGSASSTGSTNSLSANLTAGVTYYLWIDTWPTPNSPCPGTFSITEPQPPPANDECADAVTLTVNPDFACGTVTAGTVAFATASGQPNGSCGGTADDDVWYNFTATNTAHRVSLINITGSTSDMYMKFYQGSDCGTMTDFFCSDAETANLTGLTVGETYYVRVYTYTSTAGQTSAFNICVGTPPPPPANDDCTGAVALTVNPDFACGVVTAGTVMSATASTGATGCSGSADDDVWYSFTATGMAHRVSLLNVGGSVTDMYMAFYSGSCGSLANIFCSDPNEANLTGLVAGNTYYVRVYTYTATSGQTTTFNICVGTPPPPPTCPSGLGPNTVSIASLPYTATGHSTCGNGNNITSTNAVACGNTSYYGGEDRTYIFTAPVSGEYTITVTTGSDQDAGITLFQGCPFDGGSTCVGFSQSLSDLVRTITATLTAGETYYLVVDNWPSPNCVTTYNVSITPPPTCLAPTGLALTGVTVNSVNFSWNASATPVVGYDWEVRQGGSVVASGSTGAGTLNATAGGLTANQSYDVYVRANCGGGDESAWAGPVNFFTGYCPAGGTTNTRYIESFSTTGGITNITNTGTGFSTGGYADYTAQAVTVVEGGSFGVQMVGGNANTYRWSIWVDWNNDMQFANPGERMFFVGSYTNAPSGTITVPGNVAPGNYRMRVRNNWLNDPTPCGTDSYSETEDYTVTVVPCMGNQVVVRIATDNLPVETSWQIVDAANNVIASGAPTTANAVNTASVCLSNSPGAATYGFRINDSFGDGISGGGWELRSAGGKLILRDNFSSGSVSPANPGASPAYGSAHSFTLPLGPADIAANECNIFDNLLGNKVYCNKVTGAANYQFEFSDPDAGFIRRIARPYNYVAFGDMVTNPLTPGVKYFARVRTDKNGPMASAHWGSGCEMGISTQVLGCSGLIQAPAYGHSCNETRSFNTNNSFIYAKPVQGGTEYQFRIYNTGEGYDETFTRSTYILQLKWNSNVAPPLVNGNTYMVEINVKVNGVWSGFCAANVCSITIDNTPAGNRMTEVAMGEATLWPNPVRDGQVNLNIEGITAADQHITVDVTDIYGQHVYGQEFGNSGDRFNTVLSLPGDIATGMYLVNITINGEVTTKRLSIVR
ncbi:MAG TPA: GEVED domain-containing protein [Flavobacteriales bacterium]|nr:GEVED domain-containing protein [Flavobacteriales bacterium]